MIELTVDGDRDHLPATGIFVRALIGSRWRSVDIVRLDAASLQAWLRSRGGMNERAESVVFALLCHDWPAE